MIVSIVDNAQSYFQMPVEGLDTLTPAANTSVSQMGAFSV